MYNSQNNLKNIFKERSIVVGDSESSILMLNELENNKIEPWEDVKNSWLKTFHLRNRKLFFDNLSVAEYMTAYQCLSLNTGYQLVQLLIIVIVYSDETILHKKIKLKYFISSDKKLKNKFSLLKTFLL